MSQRPLLRCLHRVIIAGALFLSLLSGTSCGNKEEILIPGRLTTRPLSAQETIRYPISLKRGDFLHIAVDQLGIDAKLELQNPAGQTIVVVDSFLAATGTERLLWVAETSGAHHLEITPFEDTSGHVAILLDKPRPATDLERQEASAAKAFYDANQLIAEDDFEKAKDGLEEALKLWTNLSDDTWKAETHFSLGYLYKQQNPKDSLSNYQEAADLAKSNNAIQAGALLNIGDIYREENDLEKAREAYERSLQLWQDSHYRSGEAYVANELGFIAKIMRESSAAMKYYNLSFEIWEDVGNIEYEAIALHNMGWLYAQQKKWEQALENFQRALELAESLQPKLNAEEELTSINSSIAKTLTGIGYVYKNLGDLDQALQTLAKALELRKDDRRGRGVTLARMGEVYEDLGQHKKAQEFYEEALEIFQDMADTRNRALVLQHMGRLQEKSTPPEAIKLNQEALRLARSIEDPDMEAAALFGIARAERQNGNLELAKKRIDEALNIAEDLRTRLDDEGARSDYFASKQDYFDFYINLLMELRFNSPEGVGEALTLSERSRARSLLDSLAESGIDLRASSDSKLLLEEQRLESYLDAKRHQLTELLLSHAEEQQIEALRKDINDDLHDLNILRSRIRESNPLYAEISHPQPLSAHEIQEQLVDEDTIFLEYQLGSERSYLWAMTHNSLESFALPSQREMEKTAEWAYDVLSNSHKRKNWVEAEEVLEDLSNLLLFPARHLLQDKNIVVIAEGALQKIPFAAIPLPEPPLSESHRPLISEHNISSLPSASILFALRQQIDGRSPPEKDIAILADPVFDINDPRLASVADPQMARAEESLPSRLRTGRSPPERLLYTAREAEAILGLVKDRNPLVALNFDASKDIFMSEALEGYRYVHIATHGFLDPDFPDQSSLVLSLVDSEGRRRDGYLYIDEIYRRNLRAEVVTLSACETARGREVRGEGIVGWAQGFLYAGARRVILSLWKVDDEATAALMSRFYRYMLQEDLTPATALRRAQDDIRREPRWEMPYYWAGFVLQGEYR